MLLSLETIMDVKSNIQANADKAAKNTVNKLDESKRIVNNFRSKTNKRLQRIQSQQSLHQQQKQSQLVTLQFLSWPYIHKIRIFRSKT